MADLSYIDNMLNHLLDNNGHSMFHEYISTCNLWQLQLGKCSRKSLMGNSLIPFDQALIQEQLYLIVQKHDTYIFLREPPTPIEVLHFHQIRSSIHWASSAALIQLGCGGDRAAKNAYIPSRISVPAAET